MMTGRSCLAAIVVISCVGLLDSSPGNAMVPAEKALKNGTVSQGGVTVPLGSRSNCGLRGLLQPGCTSDQTLHLAGFEDGRLPLRTPGALRVHMIAPVQFLQASSAMKGDLLLKRRRIKGFVRQLNPTEAVIKFRQALRTGEVVGVSAEYNGHLESFFFLPVARRRALVKQR